MIKSVLGHEDLMKVLSEKTGKSQKEVSEFYDALVEEVHTIIPTLKEKEKFVLKDIVSFSATVKEAHVGRNPHTNEAIDVPEKTRVSAKVSGAVKKTVQR